MMSWIRYFACGAAFCALWFFPERCPAEERTWDAEELLAWGRSQDVEVAQDSLVLESGVLISDDGPAAGYSYRPNEEPLDGGTLVRKDLLLDDPRARQVVLLVGPGGQLQAELNGQSVLLTPHGKAGQYWQQYLIDAKHLRAGENRIVLSGQGKLWIARDDEFAAGAPPGVVPPRRSSRSLDGGRTWQDRGLGKGNNIDGEYYVRLFLDRYLPRGEVQLPVVDVGSLRGDGLAPSLTKALSASVRLAADIPAGTRIKLLLRSGTTWIVDDEHWSAIQEFDGPAVEMRELRGRFVQGALRLETSDPLATPAVRSVTVTASSAVAPADWSRQVRVVANDAQPIVRTSIPFAYEPFDHPRLKELREKHHLDQIAAAATSEWDLICRLAVWSSQRWTGLGHLGESYPPWDALAILSPHTDGTPVGGFCQQANVVFLQACESLGLCARAVSIGPSAFGDRIRGGHETVEVWSNDHRRWVYVDGNTAWYAVDTASGLPLSLRELRARQLQAFAGKEAPTRIVVLAETRHTWKDLASWPPFVELRMIPRSNFLQQPQPLPLHQGMRGWFWTGHHVWTDQAAPAAMLYGNRESAPANWDWTLNTVDFRLEALPQAGHVQVHLDSETPGWQAYEVAIDGQTSDHGASRLAWTLHAGENRLVVRSKNIAGRRGPPSQLTLEYQP